MILLIHYVYPKEITKIKNQIKKRLKEFFFFFHQKSRKPNELIRLFVKDSSFPIFGPTRRSTAAERAHNPRRLLAVRVGIFGGRQKLNPAIIYFIGAAMELIHSYFLIHDDIKIDQDDLAPRGGGGGGGEPSMHCRFQILLFLKENISPVFSSAIIWANLFLAILAFSGDISSV